MIKICVFFCLQAVRMAGGQVWEDPSLADWEGDDFRIFCGDLGNDVNDEILTRTFNKFPSFTKAKVIRDKRTGKSKGFGFVSFKEPADFIRAMKEMDGNYAYHIVFIFLVKTRTKTYCIFLNTFLLIWQQNLYKSS